MTYKLDTSFETSFRLIILNEQSVANEHYFMNYLPYKYLQIVNRVDGLSFNHNIVIEVKDSIINVRKFYPDDMKSKYTKYKIFNSNKVVYFSESKNTIQPSTAFLDSITKSKYYLNNSEYIAYIEEIYNLHLYDKYMYNNLKLIQHLLDIKVITYNIRCNSLLCEITIIDKGVVIPLVNFIDCLNIINYRR